MKKHSRMGGIKRKGRKMEPEKGETMKHEKGESKAFEAKEKDRKYRGKSMKLGGGGRFQKLKGQLASKGAKNPGALAAYIGRKKYGAKKMASMSAKAKRSAGAPRGSKNPFGTLKTDKQGGAKAGSTIYPAMLSKTTGQTRIDTGKSLLQKAMKRMARK